MKLICKVCAREYTAARWDPPNICRSCADEEMLEEAKKAQVQTATIVCKCCGQRYPVPRTGPPSEQWERLCNEWIEMVKQFLSNNPPENPQSAFKTPPLPESLPPDSGGGDSTIDS